MREKIVIAFIVLAGMFSLPILAQGPPPPPPPPVGSDSEPPCWPPPCIPVNQGVVLLLLAGTAYGLYSVRSIPHKE